MTAFTLRIAFDAGTHPLTGAPLPAHEEIVTVEATDEQHAYRLSALATTFRAQGQRRHVYNVATGEQLRDERR